MNHGVELIRQAGVKVVAESLGLGPIDDADEAFQPGAAQAAAQFARDVEMQHGARLAGGVELALDAVLARGPHRLHLHRRVPVGRRGDGAGVGAEADQGGLLAEAAAAQLAEVNANPRSRSAKLRLFERGTIQTYV